MTGPALLELIRKRRAGGEVETDLAQLADAAGLPLPRLHRTLDQLQTAGELLRERTAPGTVRFHLREAPR